jgi:hypothetical protein
MSRVILEDRSLSDCLSTDPDRGVGRLRCLLALSAGWYAFSWHRLADPILTQSRELLWTGNLQPRDKARIACAVTTAMRMTTWDFADLLFVEMFERLGQINETYSTSGSHFSVNRLEVVESVVLTAVQVYQRN